MLNAGFSHDLHTDGGVVRGGCDRRVLYIGVTRVLHRRLSTFADATGDHQNDYGASRLANNTVGNLAGLPHLDFKLKCMFLSKMSCRMPQRLQLCILADGPMMAAIIILCTTVNVFSLQATVAAGLELTAVERKQGC